MIFLKRTCQKYSPMAKTTVLPKTGGSPYSLLPLYLLALSCHAKKSRKDYDVITLQMLITRNYDT